MPTATRYPVYGYPVRVVLPDRTRVVWWGPDEDDDDLLAAADGRVLAWPDLGTCLTEVRVRGWDEAAPDEAPDEQDLRPAAAWLDGLTSDLETGSALAVWNLASDVAASTGEPWDCDDEPGAAEPWTAEADVTASTGEPWDCDDEPGPAGQWTAEAGVAASTREPWDADEPDTAGQWTAERWAADQALDDACHEKLTFATVPWLAGRDEYVPMWTPAELRHLRRRLASALTLITAALP